MTKPEGDAHHCSCKSGGTDSDGEDCGDRKALGCARRLCYWGMAEGACIVGGDVERVNSGSGSVEGCTEGLRGGLWSG
jgi:hypothetical protein